MHQVSYEEYLRIEEAGIDVRHEYVDGFLYAMLGASNDHGVIVSNRTTLLRPAVRGTGCRVYGTEVKLRVSCRQVYYPDLMVVCDPGDRDDPLITTKPCLVIEVLSPGTHVTDRREMRRAYEEIPTLLAYLMIHPDDRRVERHWRADPTSSWQTEFHTDGAVPLVCPRRPSPLTPCTKTTISRSSVCDDGR
jgi:Uma2 family endonuclease